MLDLHYYIICNLETLLYGATKLRAQYTPKQYGNSSPKATLANCPMTSKVNGGRSGHISNLKQVGPQLKVKSNGKSISNINFDFDHVQMLLIK